MGDVADMMLDGTLCQSCGVYIGSDLGIPGYCRVCKKEANQERHTQEQAAAKKVPCPTCGKKVKQVGLANHMKDAHPAERNKP